MLNESLNVCVLGLGKVGLPLASYLGWRGHKVYGFDSNPDITKRLMAGESTLPWEPRIYLEKITVRDSLEGALDKSELVYIIVPTPMEDGNRLSSEFVRRAREGVEKCWSGTIVIGSTLDPRDAGDVCDASHVVYNPPLIRLGHVFEDLRDMSVLLIGQRAVYAQRWVEWLWMHNARVVVGDPESIAVAKLAINVSLSMRIAWANELADVCRRYRVSDTVVLEAVRSDPRLGRGYLGVGFPPGGPCLPRDLEVWTQLGSPMAEAVQHRHEDERIERVRALMSTISAAGTPRLAILGLVYKAGAVDCTETLGMCLAREAKRRGWEFRVYDPAQFYLPQDELEGLPLAVTAEAAIQDATDVVITADWPEFHGLDLSGKCVFNLGDR